MKTIFIVLVFGCVLIIEAKSIKKSIQKDESAVLNKKILNKNKPLLRPVIIAIEIVDPNENNTKSSKNSKRTINSQLGYGYQNFLAPQPPKYQVYKYSQQDIPPYRGSHLNLFTANNGKNQFHIQKSISYNLPSQKYTSINSNLNQYYQPGTTLFSMVNNQGQLEGLSQHLPYQGTEPQVPVLILRVYPSQLSDPSSMLYPSLPQNHPLASALNSVDLQSLLQRYVEKFLHHSQSGGYPVQTQTQYHQPTQEYSQPSQTYSQPSVPDYSQTPSQQYLPIQPTSQHYSPPTAPENSQVPSQQYGTPSAPEYSQPPNQHYSVPSAGEHSQSPNQQYSVPPVPEHSQSPSQQYLAPSAPEYSQSPNQQYSAPSAPEHPQPASQQYSQTPSQEYSQPSSQDYSQSFSQEYSQLPSQEYTQSSSQTHIQPPNQQYSQPGSQEYLQIQTQQHSSGHSDDELLTYENYPRDTHTRVIFKTGNSKGSKDGSLPIALPEKITQTIKIQLPPGVDIQIPEGQQYQQLNGHSMGYKRQVMGEIQHKNENYYMQPVYQINNKEAEKVTQRKQQSKNIRKLIIVKEVKE